MASARKRRKELNKLTKQAQSLWDDQRDLLDNAGRVAKEAGRQAGRYAREDVAPRIQNRYDHRVRPVVDSAFSAADSTLSNARSAADSTRKKISKDLLPGAASAIGTALAAIEVAKDHQLRDAIERASKFGTEVGIRAGIIQPKPKAGPGKYIVIGLGVVAFVAVAYAAWQTLRADDDLWVEEEPAATPLADES